MNQRNTFSGSSGYQPHHANSPFNVPPNPPPPGTGPTGYTLFTPDPMDPGAASTASVGSSSASSHHSFIPPGPGGPFSGGPPGPFVGAPFANMVPGGINPDLLYAAGSSVLNHYGSDFQEKSKTWISEKLKYFFAVDTAYVAKKLILLFFPFTHTEWSVRYAADGPIAPKDDVNAPDLYIPSMAFVTFILLAGFLLGTGDEFSPEKLGIIASSALAWLLMEVFIIMTALYLLSISCALGFFHLLAYSSYKFVPMVAAMLFSYIFNSNAVYSLILLYTSVSLAFFLLRSLHVTIQTTSVGNTSPQNGLYLVLVVCLLQAVIMYWQTRNLVAISSK